MESIMQGIYKIVFRILGISKIIDQFDEKPWMAILLVSCIVLTILWMVKFFPTLTAGIGKTVGGIAIGMIKFLVGIVLALWLVHTIIGLGTSMIGSGLRQIWIIGPLLASAWGAVVAAFGAIIIAIGIGIYLLKNISSLMGKGEGSISGAANAWQDEKGGGLEGVKWSYVICALIPIAGMINHPEFNEPLYFIPSGLSALAGLVSLAFKTKIGRARVDNITAGRKKPRPDGAWKCPNHSEQDVLVDGKKTGKKKKTYCKGPQGKDVNGESYNGWNPKDADKCLSVFCDYLNPHWQKCHKDEGGCGYSGVDSMGFSRTPDLPVKCPKCMKVWPAIPKTMPFHDPSEDSHNTTTQKTCPHCGKQNSAEHNFCVHCKKDMRTAPSAVGTTTAVVTPKCPNCGAPNTGDPTKCDHCHTAIGPVLSSGRPVAHKPAGFTAHNEDRVRGFLDDMDEI